MKPKNSPFYGKYIDDFVHQVSKRGNAVCGDFTLCERNQEMTVLILCDGMGSGIKANLAARMYAAQLLGLIQAGISLYDACKNIIHAVHKARTEEVPFAAFSVAQILADGQYTVLSYESPSPLIIENRVVYTPNQRFFSLGHEVVGEAIGKLSKGDCLMLMSDGVTQAGLGMGYPMGWGTDGTIAYLSEHLKAGVDIKEAIHQLVEETKVISGNAYLDDTTVALLTCKQANILNILTGPPATPGMDYAYVNAFLAKDGKKVICGSTTADIFSRVTGRQINLVKTTSSYTQPPQYKVEGIDLVTEGAATLNQLYNILDESEESFEEESGVTELYRIITEADIIRIFRGSAINDAHTSIVFRQMGVLPRKTILSLIIEKLKKMGKLLVVEKW